MNTNNTAIFEADPEGWRGQNSDRPPEHLVRELIQNALDEEGVTQLDVEVTYHGPRRGTTVKVSDNAPGGVKDLRLLFTLWLSDKEDSPTKRGRMGRGLKELVSVADLTTIRSCSQDALVFHRAKGGRWERKVKPRLGRPAAGTEVTAFVRGWGTKAAKQIVAFLKRVRAPNPITMRVGFRDATVQPNPIVLTELDIVRPFTAPEKYELVLETVIYELDAGERKARDRYRTTTVECFTPPPGEKAYVYELGIPVEACDSPVSIDVGQRVILRERRDTLTDAYRRNLFAKVLSARIDKLPDEALRDNATLTAAAASYVLSDKAKQRITAVWTGGRPFAATPQDRSAATGHHVEVVNLRSLPEAVRTIVKEVGVDVKKVMEERRSEFCPKVAVLTPAQQQLVTLWEWIAKGIHRECHVEVHDGAPSCHADFNRDTKTLSLYVGTLGDKFFNAPLGAAQLALLCHELSHMTPTEDEHSSGFYSDVERVGGEVAAFLFNNAEQGRLMLREEAAS